MSAGYIDSILSDGLLGDRILSDGMLGDGLQCGDILIYGIPGTLDQVYFLIYLT